MVDETLPPPAASGPPDRRRPAPTIELEATEIASRPVAGESSGGSSAPSDRSEQAASDHDTGAPVSRAGMALRWPLLGGALLGATAALAGGAVVLWVGGGNDSGALEMRVAQLEQQVGGLAAKMPTDVARTAEVGALASRVGKLEGRVEAQAVPAAQPEKTAEAAPSPADPALEARITALEGSLKSLGERLEGVSQRGDSAAATNGTAINELAQKLARTDVSGLQSNEAAAAAADAATATIADLTARLDALEAGTKALAAQEKQQEKQAADSADDHTLRTAIIASSLAALVERGRPYAAELKAAQAQAADAGALAPLERFATTGVPNAAVLTRELTELLPALQRAAGHPEGFLDKLQANAERLVRIRPIEQTPGDDPPAILSRVEFKAVHNDVPGLLTELGNLPDNVRAPAQAWIDKAQAREAARAATRVFAADALAALGKR